MAVTKSWEARAKPQPAAEARFKNRERRREFWWLLGATALVAGGLAVVFAAKTQDFAESQARLTSGELLNLNAASPEQVLVPSDSYVNERLHALLASHAPLANVGALSRLRLTAQDAQADQRAMALWQAAIATRKTPPPSVPLLPLGKFKPQMVVRTPKEFMQIYALWTALYLAAFWVVHIGWRLRRFRGDGTLLPALQLLSGFGLMLMVSLRDPLRDTLEFKKFAWGCVAGCALLLLLPLVKLFDYRRFSKMVYTPLFIALALFAGLLRFGSGPTGSDAKVNLGPFQPVEAIKILLVFFMAAYFAKKWEHLRDLQLKAIPLKGVSLPRLSHALPVMFGVACALTMFFVLKDMGPALVMGFLFLILFAVARGRAGLALLGVSALVIGVVIGNHLGTPHTVVERVSMWLSPWDNDVRGGDQLAHSLWAFATGGPLGSGPGWGDPSIIPAGHTDLVLASIGEEWGLPGVAAIALLFAFLLRRGFRIALEAPDEFGMFLGLGLSALLGLEMLLISGGALGAIPLSGVVSPFLSSGNTAMLANFFIFAVLAGISNQSAPETDYSVSLEPVFRVPFRLVGATLGAAALALLVRAAVVETVEDKQLVARDALVFTADGVKRPEHNPRLNLLAAEIPRGNIYDRNGVLLASSRWDDLEKHRDELAKLGVNIDQACRKSDSRYYPFGSATEHLLGDFRTGDKFHASNSSLIEHDSNTRLQGYRDYSDLAPVVRYRHQRANPELQALLKRDRDVHSTIDIRLQVKAAEILAQNLEVSHKKGALVVMNAQSGEVLALVSYPAPPANGSGTPDELLDRARYGQYPPGSTFKLVTAMAALRLDPRSTDKRYNCHALGDGRTGTIVPGWRRPVRDDIEDRAHGTIDMAQAISVSCNAYFAQLGVDAVGSQALRETANLLGISVGTPEQVKRMLPFTSYGQGEAIMTPFKMARVAATIADAGSMPEGKWVTDPSNKRVDAAHPILAADSAVFLQKAMRSVVTDGTARAAMAGLDITVAGKTGTAQLDQGEPHSWFAGFAPFDAADANSKISFAVVVEHGGYGAKFAAPIARQVVEAARDAKIISEPDSKQANQ